MGTARLDAEKLRTLLAGAVNPYGIVKDFQVGTIQAFVRVNGKEELFEIDGLYLSAEPKIVGNLPGVDRSGETVRTPPAGRGKIRLASVDGQAVSR